MSLLLHFTSRRHRRSHSSSRRWYSHPKSLSRSAGSTIKSVYVWSTMMEWVSSANASRDLRASYNSHGATEKSLSNPGIFDGRLKAVSLLRSVIHFDRGQKPNPHWIGLKDSSIVRCQLTRRPWLRYCLICSEGGRVFSSILRPQLRLDEMSSGFS